ncbi:MAG TPA: type II toxin-antitoxin system HipA family toxin YjjJ [Casimicrobiaceae bacterium]
MRTPHPFARERLLQMLRSTPRRSTSELARQLGVSAQSVRRLLGQLPARTVLLSGRTHRVRYALRRALRGVLEDVPLYAIDATGQAQLLASLALVQPEGTLLPLEGTVWPVPDQARDGWWDGLPYPIFGVRPQGYLGRQFARAEHRSLGVSENPEQWSDDDIVWVLSHRGADVTGNLLLGNDAYELWVQDKMQDPVPLDPKMSLRAYGQRAQEAVSFGAGGSSAAGEFPKFAALRELQGAATPHVLVKFSGAATSAAERRWGDLLVCEHRALVCATKLPGVRAPRSRILTHGGRVFLEVERFDRVGPHGRLPVCALDAIQPAFLGSSSTNWLELGAALHRMGLLDAASVATVEHLWWFGRLIANTDMHVGNLTFHVERTLRLAPTYDMLPMAYAPLAGGEVPRRDFTPPLPLPPQRRAWLAACAIAIEFWTEAASDRRISEPFRGICRANAARLHDIAGKV